MTMHEINPNTGHTPERSEAEAQAQLNVLADLNVFYDAIQDWELQHPSKVMLGKLVSVEDVTTIKNKRSDGSVGEEMPEGHYYQMVWRPKSNSSAADELYEMIARKPYFEIDEPQPDLPDGVEKWIDFALEVTFREGQVARYWLNSRGLVPYTDSADIIMIDAPISSDLFYVDPIRNPEPAQPKLSCIDLGRYFRGKQLELKTQVSDPDKDSDED
jgi:hypothetical protein